MSALIFRQDDAGGYFFEMNNGKTVRPELVDYAQVGYEIGTRTGDRYMDNVVIKSMISMQYELASNFDS